MIDAIAAKNTKIITLTITEGGYNIDKARSEFILTNDQIQHDLYHPEQPVTVFGFVAAGLRKRMKSGHGPM